jgi:hypothetical protein
MNLLQKKLFKIGSQRVTDYFSGSYSNEHVIEGIDIITSTKDLPFETMLDAEIFSWYINTFHINGISTLLSRLVYKHLDIDYSVFYEDLFQYLQNDEWFVKEQKEVRQYFANWMTQGQIRHPDIGGIEIHGWNLIHRTVLNMHVENQSENIFDRLEAFMQRYNLPKDLLASAMKFQKKYLIDYNKMNEYPQKLELDYNLWEFMTFDEPLQKRPSVYNLDFPEDKNMSFPRFLELFYFARRRNFGKATVDTIESAGNSARRGEASAKAMLAA